MGELIGLGQLRSDTCGYFERVAAGETIEVVRRGRPAGRIVPIAGGPREPSILRSVDAGMCRLDDLRTRAGRLFDRVAAGEIIEVVWQDRLVARIVSAADGSARAPVDPRPVNGASCDAGQPVGIAELRTRAGSYLDRVAAGETIEVARRGRLVARIVSAAS